MKKILISLCLPFLVYVFASNSYAKELPVYDLLAFPEDGCFDVKEDGQCNWIYIGEAVYAEEWKDGNPWLGIEYDKDGNVTAIYVEGIYVEGIRTK